MVPKTYFKNHFLLININVYSLVAVLSFLIIVSSSFAQGNLLITPKRVVFEGVKRSEELNLANIGKDSATYEISFVQIRMKEDGSVEKITDADSAQLFADKYLRFFPRSVTLAPNEAQTVKVQIIRTAEIQPGEYRSHLYFRAVPMEKPLGEKGAVKDSSISVRIVPIFGISIPVILRSGELNSQVKISNLSVVNNDTTSALKMTFNRTGNMSVYGDVFINHISDNGKQNRVGVVKGLAVYTPNNIRHFNIPLNKISGVNFKSGKLQVVYLAGQTDKGEKYVEEFIDLH